MSGKVWKCPKASVTLLVGDLLYVAPLLYVALFYEATLSEVDSISDIPLLLFPSGNRC